MESVIFFWFLLVGISIAVFQDLKRREVDNWLNFLILAVGVIFIVYEAIFLNNFYIILLGGFLVFLGFIFMQVLYMGHVFAGGDAKLLFALSPFFMGLTLLDSFFNFIIFLFMLFLCGGVYGLIYSFVLYFKNFKEGSKKIGYYFVKMKIWWYFAVGVVLIVLSFFISVLLAFGILFIVFPILFSFAKGLEDVVMIKEISGKSLRVGDWLVEDIRVGRRVIKANFDGINQGDILLLKSKKKVKIKEGIPFVPSFLFAFVLYYLYATRIISYVRLILGEGKF